MTEGKFDKLREVDIRGQSYATRVASLESEHKKILKLPKDIPLVIQSKNDVRKLFSVSSVAWHEMYNPKRVKKIVSCLAEGGYSKKEKKKALKELKEIRKFGQIHRASWRLFDRSHQPPKELHKLITKMGKLKDHPGKEKKYAKKLRKAVKEYNKKMDKINDDFKPCKNKGFRNYLRKTGNEMRGILTKAKPKQVEFQHDLRKEGTRMFMNLFLLQLIKDNNPYREGAKQTKDAYFFFQRIDRKIGKLHDKAYKNKRNNGKKYKNNKKVSMMIDDDIKEQLRKGLDKLSDQWERDIKKANKNSEKNNKIKKKHKKRNIK